MMTTCSSCASRKISLSLFLANFTFVVFLFLRRRFGAAGTGRPYLIDCADIW